jgi:twitching motility two-component system response regulator PilG
VSSDNTRSLLDQGIAAAREGDWETAHPLLREVIELDPNNELGWLWLAAVSQTDQESLTYLRRVLEINPLNRRALAGIADINTRKGKSSDPSPEMEIPAPSDERCPLCRGEILAGGDKCSECGALLTLAFPEVFAKHKVADTDHMKLVIARLEAANSNGPDFETSYALGLAYLNAHRIDDAIKILRTALKLQPDNLTLEADLEKISDWKSGAGTAIDASVGRARVLVVDDSPTVRKLVEMTLERRGHVVVAAEDGMEALARINDSIPDLILLDITMPRMDGYQLCKTIKTNQETSHIPVVMLTGKDGLLDKVRSRMVGSEEHLTKPFEPAVLVNLVEKHLGSDAVS